MFFPTILNIFIIITTAQAALKKWPSRFPRCPIDHPNLNKCLVEAANKMRPFLKEGVPEMGIKPISPFIIPEVTISQGTDAVSFQVILKDLEIKGFDTYVIDKYDFDLKKLEFEDSIRFGEIKVNSKYEAKGKLLTIPIEGNGTLSATIASSNGTLKQSGKMIKKNGEEYLVLDPPNIKITVDEITDYSFDGLFGGNELLEKATKEVIQDNTKAIVEEMKPAVEKVITRIVSDIQAKSFSSFSFHELYPFQKDLNKSARM